VIFRNDKKQWDKEARTQQPTTAAGMPFLQTAPMPQPVVVELLAHNYQYFVICFHYIQGDKIALDFMIIDDNFFDALLNTVFIFNCNNKIFLSEAAGNLNFLPICWNTGINPQSTVVWLNTKDILSGSIIRPGSSTGQPGQTGSPAARAILTISKLAVNVRLDLADFGFWVIGSGHESTVILIGLIAVS